MKSIIKKLGAQQLSKKEISMIKGGDGEDQKIYTTISIVMKVINEAAKGEIRNVR